MSELDAVREWEKTSALGGYLPAEEAIVDKADAAIKALKEQYKTALDSILDKRHRIAELETELAKCESQKRGLATAAKTGMAAGNRVIELEAEVERLAWMLDQASHDLWLVECVWHGIFDEEEAVAAIQVDLAARYEEREA